jgi:hypothetical protein
MMATDNIMSRLEKLIAMANQTASPHEAEIAQRRVKALMAKHNLTETDVSHSAIKEEETDKVYNYAETLPRHISYLLDVLADVFECQAVIHRCAAFNKTSISFIGIKTDVIMAKYAMEVLSRQLINDRKKFIEQLPKRYSPQRKTQEGNNFASGWVSAISDKAIYLRSYDAEKQALVKSYFDKKFSDLEPLKERKASAFNTLADIAAWQAGAEEGEKAQLNRSVDSSNESYYLEGQV